jgi:ubiquinone/menaquinone biosynthesis C-methylase UbiE
MTTAQTPVSESTLRPSARKAEIRDLADLQAPERDRWIKRNSFYYDEDYRYMRFLIPEGSRVLDLGCGTGRLLAALKPSRGVGLDFSSRMIAIACEKYPNLEFRVGDIEDRDVIRNIEGPFDYIVLSDTIGSLDDCQTSLHQLHRLCDRNTRVVVAYYSRMWEPILALAKLFRLQMPQVRQNWLSSEDIENLFELADFEVVKREWRQLLPRRLLGLGWLANRLLAPVPVIRRACLRDYVIGRPIRIKPYEELSTTVVIPCRNERGNIRAAVRRIPRFCSNLEILFIEGHSEDGTLDEIRRVIAAHPEIQIRVEVQDGKGKGDAVRKGFECARGQVLMILDADLTVPPEALPKFYQALMQGKGEFINGTRLVYPMEQDAMRILNWIANQGFSALFTWLLNQRFTDTLCGTKVLTKFHYERIAADRNYFGDFDPFGDFDLIFGAVKQNLKVVEIPITYASRSYGETQISRFMHGWLLLRMVVFAFVKLKAF